MDNKPFYTLYNYKTYSLKHYNTKEELRQAIMEHLKEKLDEIEIQEDWGDATPPIELGIEIDFQELKDD